MKTTSVFGVLLLSSFALASTSPIPIVTITVSGTFTVLPNRTIAIERPTIDPSIIPIPIYPAVIPTTLAPAPLPTGSETTSKQNGPQNRNNRIILISLVAGIVFPIIVLFLATCLLHWKAFKIRRKLGISLSSWRDFMTPSPKAYRCILLEPSNGSGSAGKAPVPNNTQTHHKITKTRPTKPIVLNQGPIIGFVSEPKPNASSKTPRKTRPTGAGVIIQPPSQAGPSRSSPVHGMSPQNATYQRPEIFVHLLDKDSNVSQVKNDDGSIGYICSRHNCPVDPKTWFCYPDGESEEERKKWRNLDSLAGVRIVDRAS